ncbi:GTPase HflX [Rossellomorea vietnamensis]|uniref:GTPase HflX n=1 Tax=Rossellomorea vietnamensis TaxID=218284 RepID=A0ACD4C9Q4_9BACI|nr:GTPase HflX [Rossellomorea vietnamensis]UXH45280.1 GTPase HflX [Rossellomorea vietnamensis]
MKNENLEKVILVGCQLDDDDLHFQYSLTELAELTATAQGQVAATLIQKRDRIHPSTYIGKGKVEELVLLEEQFEADIIIFNDELSPSQIRNLSKELNGRVIDRTQLILDIFAQRARSREGKLQVELAQLQYLLPRLIGQGASLSRLGGGIGTRGPGETKLESDRRHIHKRIDDIKKQLQTIVDHRERYRGRRKRNKAFQIALVGYTNAGKSTLFNRISLADSYEENQLFATLDPMTRKMPLPSGYSTLLTDTVGFIQDLPTTLVAAFRSTLEEVKEADLLLHIVDSSNPDYSQHEKTVQSLLKDLEMDGLQQLTVYNKRDEMDPEFVPDSESDTILISALNEEDRVELLIKIEEIVKNQMIPYHVFVPVKEGKLLSQLKSETILSKLEFQEASQEYEMTGFHLEDHPIAGSIKKFQK